MATKHNNTYDYIIIGGGAAGLMCAAAFDAPVRGLILEGTGRFGTKLLATGGGHCNITHEGSIKEFITHYNDNCKKFRSIMYKYNNEHLRDFLEANGVPTYADKDGRVLPKSDKARDVLNLLLAKSKSNGFELCPNSKAWRIGGPSSGYNEIPGDANWAVETESHEFFYAKNIVVATGGISYPKTGSDGSMFTVLMRDLGVEIQDTAAALAPIKVEGYPFTDVSGLTLDATISIKSKLGTGKQRGALLLTHTDFSGPVALNMSRYACPGASLTINYLGDAKQEEVFEQIQNSMKGSKSEMATILSNEFGLTKRFAKLMADRALDSKSGSIKAKKLASLLTADNFLVSGTAGYAQAMVTRGGVKIEQINTKTMELKAHPHCYIIGEALDVDGDTGGYNLQFAYSTACAVSKNA